MRRTVIISGIVAAGVLVSGTWYFLRANGPTPASAAAPASELAQEEVQPGFPADAVGGNPAAAVPAQGPLAPPRTPPAGLKEHRNTAYRFSLFYPQELEVKAYDEGGGASTIVFQNAQKGEGFQIFVVPYAARQVSAARFREDEPSGVMQGPQNIQIDGALATMFISSDVVLGPTREVWFIHGGYLFEVTAPKVLDDWLGTIMLTWKFI